MTESASAATDGVTRRPTLALSGAAVVAALVTVLTIGSSPTSAVAVGGVGAAVVTASLLRGAPLGIDLGAVLLFGGVVLGGLEASTVESTIVGTFATVVAWDLAHSAVDLGVQLGREARTLRLEAVQIVSTLLIGLLSGTVGYAIYIIGGGSQPVAAAVFLLLAAVLLIVGLGTQNGRSLGQARRSRGR